MSCLGKKESKAHTGFGFRLEGREVTPGDWGSRFRVQGLGLRDEGLWIRFVTSRVLAKCTCAGSKTDTPDAHLQL